MRSRTYIATPPGFTIREQMDIQHMTSEDFAVRMGMSKEETESLLSGLTSITPAIAASLEQVLGVPATFWLNLETRYQHKKLLVAQENSREVKREYAFA